MQFILKRIGITRAHNLPNQHVMCWADLQRTYGVIYLNGRTSGVEGQVKTGRQFIYYYHDGPNSEELNDPFSGIPIPKKGEVIERRGKKYEVKSVQPVVGKAIPTFIIRLMNTI